MTLCDLRTHSVKCDRSHHREHDPGGVRGDGWPLGSCEQESSRDPRSGTTSPAPAGRGAPGLSQERGASARPCGFRSRRCHFACIIPCSPWLRARGSSAPRVRCGYSWRFSSGVLAEQHHLFFCAPDLQLPSPPPAQPNPPVCTYRAQCWPCTPWGRLLSRRM